MPRFDMTGPLGQGPFTGRGGGYCAARMSQGFMTGQGRGVGRGLGMRRGFFGYGYQGTIQPFSPKEERTLLEREKEYLEDELRVIKEALENLKED